MLLSFLANLLSLKSSKAKKKSFAPIFQSLKDSTDHIFVSKEPFMHMGKPIISFIVEEDECLLSEPYKFTPIGKFLYSKHSIIKVCDSFQNFVFHNDYMIGFIDASHILIHLALEDDYS